MLHYELTKSYIDFISSLPFKERGPVLWNSQAILSTAGGYLKMKVADIDEESAIFRVAEHTYLLVRINYSFIRLVDGMKTRSEPSFDNGDSDAIVSSAIKDLVAKDGTSLPHDDLEAFLEKNYFTPWFIKLFALLSEEDRNRLGDKGERIDTSSEKETKNSGKALTAETTVPTAAQERIEKQEEIRKPEVKIATIPLPDLSKGGSTKETKKKKLRQIDGEEFEKAILLELQKAYENRVSKKKAAAPAKLKHVRFAPKEIVISYTSRNSCLDLLLRRTRQNGCRLSNDNWLILLANTVEEPFAKEIESRYPDHVLYTDAQDKGNINIAFIVKKNREASEADDELDLGVKRVKSKTASFNKEMPSGAFDNIDEDEMDEWPHPRSSFIKPVKSKVATFASALPETSNDVDDEFDFQIDEDGFFFDGLDEDIEDACYEEPVEGSNEEEISEETSYPKHWHCYLCGKKKLYSGEPAQISKLGNGNVVYLCKKHRGKM